MTVALTCHSHDFRPWVDVMQSFMIPPMRRQKVAIAFGRVLREARRQKGLSQEEKEAILWKNLERLLGL